MFLLLVSLTALPSKAQIPGPNVNMVSGTQWPGGDPFLQRQNEPSMAISSRNSLHMLAGANDYRTVDLPGVSGEVEPTGDAWLGLFKSFDGGQTWTSTLVPGYPQDTSPQGLASPLKGLGAGADPSVRAGTNGMFYYSGLAFNRQSGGASEVFVASFIDDNNLEGSDTIRYIGTSLVSSGSGKIFDDKPSLAVDIPRKAPKTCAISGPQHEGTQTFPGGVVYVAWTQFTGTGDTSPAQIMFSASYDCGNTWSHARQISGPAPLNQGATLAVDPSTGYLYIAWRVFASANQRDALMYVVSYDEGSSFTKPTPIGNVNVTPFDQGDTGVSFRTNGYPSVAIDASGNLYVAWSQRGGGGFGSGGDARILIVAGKPAPPPQLYPIQWSVPVIVDNWSSRGHQIMPATAFSAGKLTVAWYDLRNDDLIETYTALGGGLYSSILVNDGGAPDFPMFGTYIQDPTPPYAFDARRQTLDVRAAQAKPGYAPSFVPSVQVSQYGFGSTTDNPAVIQQLEVNAPNLPMFMSGTLPFIGDYIDVAGPTFVANHDGTWRYNNQPTDPDFTHIVWTDNRNVVQPADGNWANYTPPTYGNSNTSIFDPTEQRPACTVQTTGNTRDRNQDIYTAQVSPGLVVSARGNAKPLSTTLQREFPITVQNTTSTTRFYQLNISSQPVGGMASFLQFAVQGLPFPMTQITVQVPGLSSTSRSVFVTSSDPHALVGVSVTEVDVNGNPVPGGQTGSTAINSDISNPNISNPNISNTEIYNPNISNPNISNPNISNPNISNPNISNPNISNPNISNTTVANPNISNPNISNPNISNPNISNPNISNPNISNPNISNAALTDVTWTVTNTGNTATSYSVKMLGNGQSVPQGVNLQLIISQSYNTPNVIGCIQAVEQHFVPVANIPNVIFYTPGQLTQPSASDPNAPAVSLLPGETAFVTIRDLDTTTSDSAQALTHFNPAIATTPGVVSQGANTGTTTPPIALVIVPISLLQATVGGAYSQQLMAAGGSGSYMWSETGALPMGVQLSPSGLLSGTPMTSGTFMFTATVMSGTQAISTNLTVLVNPAPLITTTTLRPADQGQVGYSQTLTATGGTPPLTGFSISTGSLPANLAINGSAISGNVTASPGTYGFTVQITDANNVTASKALSITVNQAPSITTLSPLPTGEVGIGYTPTLAASGGTTPLSFAPQSVDGLTLTSAGAFSNKPTGSGTFTFTATVTDSVNVSSNKLFSLTVNPALGLASSTLPAADQNVAYQTALLPSGGVPITGTGYSWGVTVGSLPVGLMLAPSGTVGAISGSSTATPGTYTFTVTVSDALGAAASQTYSIVVNGPLAISTPTLLAATTNFPYQEQLVATGGSGTYSNWTVKSGSLPAGLSLDPSSGIISGTPTAAATNPVTVSVTDSLGGMATQSYTITTGFTLVGQSAALTNTSIQLTSGTGQDSAAWSGTQQSVASGFTATFTFQIGSISGDQLADGFAFVIQGSAPNALGTGGPGGCGGCLGYTGIPNSIAIEFDDYQDSWDPNANHIAIMSNGTAANTADHTKASLSVVNTAPLPFTLEDGATHTVTITYTPGGMLSVSVDSFGTIVSAPVADLGSYLGLSNGTAWVGFTGASGAGGENAYISNWIFTH